MFVSQCRGGGGGLGCSVLSTGEGGWAGGRETTVITTRYKGNEE